jgi:hypothetical protein
MDGGAFSHVPYARPVCEPKEFQARYFKSLCCGAPVFAACSASD